VAELPSTGAESGLAAAIVDALRDVYDPCCREQGISVVDMGLIESLDVTGDRAHIELVLTSGWCPFAVQLLTEVRERVEAVAEIEGATVDILWDRGWGSERLSDDARAKLRFLPDPRAVADRAAYVAAHLAQPRREGGIER
jgi:metal-sulfur cluster biosynthetic enzyme